MKNNIKFSILFLLASMILLSFVNVYAKSAKIEELEMYLNIPEGFYPIFLDSESEDIRDLALEPNLIRTRMKEFNSYLMLYNFTSEIQVSKIENSFTKQLDNLYDVDKEVLAGLIEGYSKGFGNAEIYDTKSAKFLVFNYSEITKDGRYFYLKYKTIVNGMEITFNYINPEPFNENDRFQMKRIVDSIKFDEIIRLNKKENDYSFLVGVLISIFLIILLLLNIEKIKKISSNLLLSLGTLFFVILLVISIIWHAYGSLILYQMYGYIWAIISFFFPVVSEVVIIALYISKKGFLNYYVLGWGIILTMYCALFFLSKENKKKDLSLTKTEIKELNIKCKQCNTLNNEHSIYCKKCGNKLERTIFKFSVDVPSIEKYDRVCNSCFSKCINDSNYCSNCGSKFEEVIKSQKFSEFGNGYPLKFFKVIYNFVPILILVTLPFTLSGIYSSILEYYDGDLLLYLSSNYNKYTALYFVIGMVLNLILIYSRLRNDRNSFSRVLIYRSIFGTVEPLLTMLVLSFEFNDVSSIVVNSVINFGVQLIITVLILKYLKKRMNMKKDLSNLINT